MGLTKDQVLDSSLEEFQAYVEGYSERLIDQQRIAVFTGFWAGYYNNTNHAKPVGTVMASLGKKKKKAEHVNDINVENFKRTEAAFLKALEESEVDSNGE